MDHYTVMLVVDEHSPVQRFHIPKAKLKQAAYGVLGFVLLLALCLWDYTRVRADNAELDELRVEVVEQRDQIAVFEQALESVNGELEQVRELERKVRIIANLPGAAGVGGEDVSELAPPIPTHGQPDTELAPPAGVPVERGPLSSIVPVPTAPLDDDLVLEREGLTTKAARYVNSLEGVALSLGVRAGGRGDSLDALVEQLEEKRHHLASMPSVWPTRGWLTSRFGARISPFTGRRQHHSGIDVAARAGTPIVAPARGRIVSIGERGPLGNSLKIDHGFGVKTFYGHNDEIYVKVGDEVERGQKIAAVGSTGRSTGPHLHYAIHVNGKARNPLDYIFD